MRIPLMLTPFLVFVLFICFTVSLKGKQKYVEGYIITLQGDTMPGFILRENLNYCPPEISFKTQPDGEPATYTPQTIAGFGANNQIYESATVTHETSPSNITDLERTPVPNYVIDLVFVLQLIGGEKSLYAYKDERGATQFYIKTPDELQLLKYKAYFIEEEMTKKMQENIAYKYQLKDYLTHCKDIDLLLADTKYDLNNMLNLFTRYYKCTQKPLRHKAKLPLARKQKRVFISMGATLIGAFFFLNSFTDLR